LVRNMNFTEWSREVYDLALKYAYVQDGGVAPPPWTTSTRATGTTASTARTTATSTSTATTMATTSDDTPSGEPMFRCRKNVKLVLPPGYVSTLQTVMRERVALAGYRLAALLDQTLPPYWVPPVNGSDVMVSKVDLEKEIQDLLTMLKDTNSVEMTDRAQFTSIEIVLALLCTALAAVLLTLLVVYLARRMKQKPTARYQMMSEEKGLDLE